MEVPVWVWIAFVVFILAMLAIDLFLHRDHHEVSIKEAGTWSTIWVTLGLSFGIVIWLWQGGGPAGEYVAGYLIEKSLSVDNIFVFALILSYFKVPKENQHDVLFWGVLGALVFRAIFIVAGVRLIETFHFMIYVFGAFLVVTGIRMFFHDEDVHPDRNPVLRFTRRLFPVTKDYEGAKFFTIRNGKRMATPMLAVLIVVETTDIIFAVDSIPAILAVTRDTFLVFSSNAFAILGLRALYFLLAGVMDRFVYLKAGLAAILAFVGVKMLISEVYEIPIWASLAFITAALAVAVGASLKKTGGTPSREEAAEANAEAP